MIKKTQKSIMQTQTFQKTNAWLINYLFFKYVFYFRCMFFSILKLHRLEIASMPKDVSPIEVFAWSTRFTRWIYAVQVWFVPSFSNSRSIFYIRIFSFFSTIATRTRFSEAHALPTSARMNIRPIYLSTHSK